MIPTFMPANDICIQTAEGGNIYCTDITGPGPALILIHGWCGNRAFWHHQIDRFGNDFRLVVVDLPGSGRSTLPTANLSLQDIAQSVVAVADHLDLQETVLIGHSMGGPVAVEAAISLGPRCRMVIGVDTFTDPRFYLRRPRKEIRERCAYFGLDFSKAMHEMINDITGNEASPSIVEWIANEMCNVRKETAIKAMESLLLWDIETRWNLLKVPCWTINAASSREFSKIPCLSNIREVIIENSGHFPMIEQPRDFNEKLHQILVGED